MLPVLWLNKQHRRTCRCCGLTLIELLVTLVILSILAAAALPYAELTVRRNKELELRRALREVRMAIDAFHDDWKAARISKFESDASDDGYPKTLKVIVAGALGGDVNAGRRRYLRRVPLDPFADQSKPPEEQWILVGYQDEPSALTWNGKDVYDIHTGSDRQAMDGTNYRDW